MTTKSIGEAGPSEGFRELLESIAACRICRDEPRYGSALPHEPRPVLQARPEARLCIVGQAPGTRVHQSGRPYTDPSGVRLRDWLGIGDEIFYDQSKVAVVPMGFCFPGHDAAGGDLPPRRECAEVWHDRMMSHMAGVELVLLIGQYAQRWHLDRARAKGGVTETVRQWRAIYDPTASRRFLPLPHPSWRNSGWLKRHGWFEDELLPVLRADVARLFAV